MEKPNLNYIKQFSNGEKSFEDKLLSIIKLEFPAEKEVYYQNLKSNNFKLASENVHKLKHKISILGLEKSYAVAVVFENNLLEGNTDLSEEFESILNNMTNYLSTV